LCTVLALSWGDDHGERSPFAVAGQMELGRQPALAAPEPLVGEWMSRYLGRTSLTSGS
jgi:hypothetical protein